MMVVDGINCVKLSIIIVTFNSNDLIVDCLDSIFTYSDIDIKNFEVIIVDNSEEAVFKELIGLVKGSYGNKIKFHKNEKNFGYGHGNNVGVITSLGEIICIMNPDVRLIESMFSMVIFEFKRNSKLCMLGFKQIGGSNLSYFLKPEWYFPIIESFIVRVCNKINLFSEKYFFLSGAFFFIDKKKFVEIGMFDENIFLYKEESDVSNRFLKRHYEIKFDKNLKYLHLIGDRNSFSEKSFRVWLRSTCYYFNKYNLNTSWFIKKLLFEYRCKKIISIISGNKKKYLKFDHQIRIIKENLN